MKVCLTLELKKRGSSAGFYIPKLLVNGEMLKIGKVYNITIEEVK